MFGGIKGESFDECEYMGGQLWWRKFFCERISSIRRMKFVFVV